MFSPEGGMNIGEVFEGDKGRLGPVDHTEFTYMTDVIKIKAKLPEIVTFLETLQPATAQQLQAACMRKGNDFLHFHALNYEPELKVRVVESLKKLSTAQSDAERTLLIDETIQLVYEANQS